MHFCVDDWPTIKEYVRFVRYPATCGQGIEHKQFLVFVFIYIDTQINVLQVNMLYIKIMIEKKCLTQTPRHKKSKH